PPKPHEPLAQTFVATALARMDTLISKKRRLIKLLDERCSNFVSATVTTGCDSSCEPSTTNRYVRVIPKHWRLMRLRHVVEQIIDTPHKTAPVVDDGEYLVVRTSNVKKGRLVLDGARYTDRASWLEWNRRGEPGPGDVLLTREAPIGEACIVPADIRLCIGQRMVLIRVKQAIVSGEWIVHSIYSGHAQRFIADLSNATTVAHLNMSDIPDIPIAVPALSEQRQLLSRIRSEIRCHEEAVSMLDTQINLLAERRQALIMAAVTGETPMSGRRLKSMI
ncbi:MAG: restriction endonuclease subunit S, partial [Acidimicrobiaceae bacterium]|nr:restriction endonuclease subunit S [Acidimicrobiaceae bacterium]